MLSPADFEQATLRPHEMSLARFAARTYQQDHVHCLNDQRGCPIRPVSTEPREVQVTRPDELWHPDMTSVWVAEHGWCYLNAAIDCCTREIVG
jgi:transposase InsO family protein